MRLGSEYGAALSAALFCLALTPELQAQGDPIADPAAPAADAPAPAPSEPAPSEPTAPTPEPANEAAAEQHAAAAATPPTPPLTTDAPDPAREKAIAAVGVERLPGSAYPAARVRGIKGGSLWLTMHGQQWPYMPDVAGAPGLRLGVSGSVWSDLSYARITAGLENVRSQKRFATQSRAVLRATPTYSTKGGWFAQGQAELVAQGDQSVNPSDLGTTDDLYVRIGKWNVFDVTVGRFQGWEIANHYGMGLDQNTLEREGAIIQGESRRPAAAYGLSYFWDRQNGRLGTYAIHAYPTDFLRFEVLGQLGGGTVALSNQANFRPSGILDFGIIKLKAGYEYGRTFPIGDDSLQEGHRNGFGGALQFVLDPWIEAGISGARGFEDQVNDQGVLNELQSNTVTGFGGFINGRVVRDLILGAGAFNSYRDTVATDERRFPDGTPYPTFGDPDRNRQFQAFFAAQYSFWDVFYLKFVGSYAHFRLRERSTPSFRNTMVGGRLRLMVLF
jgi:hypothetical protein